MKKHVVILGAGPAGLTAAYELLKKQDVDVTFVEVESQVGGLSRTIVYNGYRMDIGGHRFFSKSSKIMDWWKSILPIQGSPSIDDIAKGRDVQISSLPNAPDPEKDDLVFLIRTRISRILYLRKFFDYPISLSLKTISQLGVVRFFKIIFSYLYICIFPRVPEENLEDFLINRFGKELYNTFFKDYTFKVWGIPCKQISPNWGAQRIKGISIRKILEHAIKKYTSSRSDIEQKDVETSLIERFLYPKFGPGQLWEEIKNRLEQSSTQFYFHSTPTEVVLQNKNVVSVTICDTTTQKKTTLHCDYLISSIPLKDLITITSEVPSDIQNISNGLVYRDFITVGVLLKQSPLQQCSDTWIYVQDSDINIGRIQIFNNWSPYLVKDRSKLWIGLEYFANEGDSLWSMKDDDFISMAISELEKLGFVEKCDVLDTTIFRIKKAYPAYFGTYEKIHVLQEFIDTIGNLYPIGRNGTHRYNNTDHSMLSAMECVQCILDPSIDKSTIWLINTEKKYHEQK